jgi:hypothetical protein
VEAHDLERLRRSIAVLQGSSAGPLTKEAALNLVDEVMASHRETARYREAVAGGSRSIWTVTRTFGHFFSPGGVRPRTPLKQIQARLVCSISVGSVEI